MNLLCIFVGIAAVCTLFGLAGIVFQKEILVDAFGAVAVIGLFILLSLATII